MTFIRLTGTSLPFLLLLGMALLLTGCSSRFVYNQLDWMLPWYIDDYVTVKTHQEPKLEKQIDQLLLWHRTQQLPEYATFVEDLKSLVNTPPSSKKVETALDDLDAFIDAIYLGVGNHFVLLAETLSREQKTEFIDNLTEKNIEYAAEYVNIGEATAREKGAQKMTDIFTDWLGNLTDDQVFMIERFAQSTEWMSPGLLHARQQWTKALNQSLLPPHSNNPGSGVLKLFENRKMFWSPRLKAQFEKNRVLLATLLNKMIGSMDAEQKQHLLDKLDGYQTDFVALSRQ
ncbi:DUF6279 family lipoprotein [Hydrogenovibrio halophilus]|uniref:DUF6279 family lipoprotein n=1 Tax=Hydrogenovibrio halophilus TaxID=373391 RepID=UPI0003700794|nr:DUF6279 family lipoprotein [Hydrogenovibrio halophilus]